MDELSELRPQFEASEARVAALQDELKRSHSQAAAAAASADQRIQVLSPLRYSCLGIFLDFLIYVSLSAGASPMLAQPGSGSCCPCRSGGAGVHEPVCTPCALCMPAWHSNRQHVQGRVREEALNLHPKPKL